MTVLLLLSALLSALTGAGPAARAPQLAVAVARQVEVQAQSGVAEVVAGRRPAVGVATLAEVAVAPLPSAAIASATPGFGERRRE